MLLLLSAFYRGVIVHRERLSKLLISVQLMCGQDGVQADPIFHPYRKSKKRTEAKRVTDERKLAEGILMVDDKRGEYYSSPPIKKSP